MGKQKRPFSKQPPALPRKSESFNAPARRGPKKTAAPAAMAGIRIVMPMERQPLLPAAPAESAPGPRVPGGFGQNTCRRGIGTTKRPPQPRIAAICRETSSRRFQGRIST